MQIYQIYYNITSLQGVKPIQVRSVAADRAYHFFTPRWSPPAKCSTESYKIRPRII